MSADWQQLKAIRFNTGDLVQPLIIDDTDLSTIIDDSDGDEAEATYYAILRMITLLRTGQYVCDDAKERIAALEKLLSIWKDAAGIYGSLHTGTMSLGLDTEEGDYGD